MQNNISRQVIFNIIFSLLFIYFAFHSIFGNRGVNAYFKLTSGLNKSYEELSGLRADRIGIEHTASLLKNGDKDILAEYAKEVLSLAQPNEKIFVARRQK